MMTWLSRCGALLVALAAPTVALADDDKAKLVEPPGAKPPAAEPATAFSHKGQFEVSARLALGLRAIATYGDENYCGKTDASNTNGNAPVCTGRAPFALDLEVGYGVAKRIDTFVEMRIGLEADFGSVAGMTNGPHPFHISPGARFFFSDAKRTKLFTTAQVVFDFAGYEDAAGKSRGSDFGMRNMNGLWFDLDKAYGVYGYVGETATFVRWMRFELEAGVGFQGRYR